MEGTVTISLADYENLKERAEKSDYYFNMAAEHIELLDRISEALTIEDIDNALVIDISKALSKWYG